MIRCYRRTRHIGNHNECTPSLSHTRWPLLFRNPARAVPIRHLQYPVGQAKINKSVKSVAILGGGITGLTSAFYLSKLFHGLPITIYEASPRLGGWLQTKEFRTGEGRIQFETGPRTIRANTISGLVIVDLIRLLNLEDHLCLMTKKAPAARNRFIYYPDKLIELPSPQHYFRNISEPLFEGLLSGIFGEIFREKRPKELTDESIGSFISRRFHPKLAENVVSAILHGIYAGDVDRLSTRAILPGIWWWEGLHGGVLKGVLKSLASRKVQLRVRDQLLRELLVPPNKWMLAKFVEDGIVMYTFVHGIETLSKALVRYLEKTPNVRIKANSTVKAITKRRKDNEKPLEVHLTNNLPPSAYSHIISTLFAPITSSLLPVPIPSLSTLEAVTIQVVSLYFPNPELLPVAGFGYLIPKSIPQEQNPENALGVIFDSEMVPPLSEDFVPHLEGTKLTVMMGGHYWSGRTIFPTEAEGIANARTLIARHLKIYDEPTYTLATLQTNCIPQYTVGHVDRMDFAHELLKIQYEGRLAVAGSSYTGVGVNDCTRAAYELVIDLAAAGTSKVAMPAEDWTGLHNISRADNVFVTSL